MGHVIMYKALPGSLQIYYLIEINLTSYATLSKLKAGFHIVDYHILRLMTTLKWIKFICV